MQQMDSGESLHSQPERGYQAEQSYNRQRQSYNDPYGSTMSHQNDVKIRPDAGSRISSGQRLALAIVSVSIIGILGIVIGSNPALGFGAFFMLGIVATTIVLINGIFNRWGAS